MTGDIKPADVCGPFDQEKAAKLPARGERLVCPWCPKARGSEARECSSCARMASRNGRDDGGAPIRRRKTSTTSTRRGES